MTSIEYCEAASEDSARRRGAIEAELVPEISCSAGLGLSPSSSLTHRSKLVTGGKADNSQADDRVFAKTLRRKKAEQKGMLLSILTLPGLGLLVGMVFLAFGVLVMLGFFSFEKSSPQPTFAAPAEGRQVTYGSVVKLMHEKTKYRLHSHDVPYGTGSGQQSVTGFPGGEDSNSLWVVKPIPGTTYKQGEPIYDGDEIRLFHTKTGKWLHSHLHASPISNNYEVSAFGAADKSDTGDHWSIFLESKGNTWLRDQKIRLQHVDTGAYLHSHDKKYSRIVVGQQEVCGVLKKGSDNLWTAAEGVYFPIKKYAAIEEI